MADKNPKHPLKKKKVMPKVTATRHDDADSSTDFTPKSKKHA